MRFAQSLEHLVSWLKHFRRFNSCETKVVPTSNRNRKIRGPQMKEH